MFPSLRRLLGLKSVKPSTFELLYAEPDQQPIPVGQLSFDGHIWKFEYSPEYRLREDLRPIEGFDDRTKIYTSSVLFPFFAVRVPDVDRGDVQRTLKEQHVSDPDTTDLLRIFGRKVLSSPVFELLPTNQ